MKKYLSVLLAAFLTLSLFSGCAPADKELEDAINRTSAAENFTAEESLKFSVETIEPYAIADDDFVTGTTINSMFAAMGKLGSNFEIKAETQKQGNDSSIQYKLIMPDLRATVNMWGRLRDDGTAQAVIKIPSYITPAMINGGVNKKYISIDTAKINDMEQFANFDMKGYTEIINDLSLKLVDKITFPITEKSGNTYTVRLDGKALEGLTKDIMAIIAQDDMANEICSAYYMIIETVLASSESEIEFPSFEEFTAMFKDGLKEAQPYADAICAAVIESGLLQNGYKAVYTLNSDGLVEKAETEMIIDLDFAKIESAFGKISDIVVGITGLEEPPKTSGKFKITVKSDADYTYGNAKADFPTLTEENAIDYYGDLAELTEYQTARNAYLNEQWSWTNYAPDGLFYDYDYARKLLLSEVKVKNADTGLEGTLPVNTIVLDAEADEYFYGVELEKIVPFFADTEMAWNEDTLCCELKYGNRLIVVPSVEAAYKISEVQENPDNIGEALQPYLEYLYDGSILYDRNFADGKCYVNLEAFMELCGRMYYSDSYYEYKLEDGTLLIRKGKGYSPFVYEKDLSGNLFMLFSY